MITTIISGGQTGADIAGWKAAKRAGIATTGYMPRGFKTEDGPQPSYAALYGAIEHDSPLYPPRTAANAAMGRVTLWFGRIGSAGYHCTRNACTDHAKAFWEVGDEAASEIARRLNMVGADLVNIAGNRESTNPGIEARVESFLGEVFALTNVTRGARS
jgi:hypothetical protein